MAGRKPSVPRDEQAGVTPLHGPRPRPGDRKGVLRPSGLQPDGSFVPQFEGQRPPFQPGNEYRFTEGNEYAFGLGNEARRTHGADRRSKRVIDAAEQLCSDILADDEMPAHVKSPAFRPALLACCRMQVSADNLYKFVAGQDLDDAMTPRKVNGKSYYELWMTTNVRAVQLWDKLGMTPVSYAKIVKDLGLNRQSAEEALGKLAGKGAEIVTRRRELEQGTPPAAQA